MVACSLLASFSVSLWDSTLCADPVWVDRRLTLTQGESGVDVGLGIADDVRDHVVGTGAFGALHYGLSDRAEISVRDGVNFGLYGRYARAEQYARVYTLSGSTAVGVGPVANPDLVFVDRIVDFGFLEVAPEFELGLPFESNTHLSGTAGVGLTFHLFSLVRVDTGFFATATLRSPSSETYAIPTQIWFEPIRQLPLWMGPLVEFKLSDSTTIVRTRWDIPVGVGVGYAITSDIDVRGEWFVPEINVSPGTRVMGGGIATQIRFH